MKNPLNMQNTHEIGEENPQNTDVCGWQATTVQGVATPAAI